MRSRRVLLVGCLLFAACVASCTSPVRGGGTFAAPASPPATGPGRPQLSGALEVTPVAAITARTEQTVLRIGLRVRNPGNGIARFPRDEVRLVDAKGTAARVVAANDAAYPGFPSGIILGPGQANVGFISFDVDDPFRAVAITLGSARWAIAGLPDQPPTGTILPPRRTAPLNRPFTVHGIDATTAPDRTGSVELMVRARSVTDPADGFPAAPGFRLISVLMITSNIGPSPYFARLASAMWVVDEQGFAYEGVPKLRAGGYADGVLGRGAARNGSVGFLVPARARISYIELSIATGNPAAIAQWQSR
jgi:hypothetical protein